TADGWIVSAPAALAAAPTPLVIEAAYGDLRATKTVWLGGASSDNPALPAITIAGAAAPPAGTEIVIAPLVDVPLATPLSDRDFDVNWLTSCGTMHDFDLPAGFVHVEPDDPHAGELALVVRDASGGVTWRIWPLRAE
ncbi:MAG TPA: hypothetical protein VFP84_16645, partial [Kofleriaceae bacterium]|nr:hypothetical protein [Kofleriaceae bacterium]